MKKLPLSLLLGITVLISIMSSCPKKTKGDDTVQIPEQPSFESFWNSLDSTGKAQYIQEQFGGVGLGPLSDSVIIKRQSRGVSAALADAYTRNYVAGLNPADRDDALKSVYFTLADLQFYIEQIQSRCRNVGDVPGIRIYLSKYGSNMNPTYYNNRLTTILRGTCNYEDLAHDPDDANNMRYIAWNYGDACPPKCVEEQGINVACRGGNYNTSGHFSTICSTLTITE